MEQNLTGPTLEISKETHATKYRGEGETFREAMNRIAAALADSDEHFHAFRDILLDMRFLPGGRVQNAMGALRAVTPYNCFVSGTIDDALVGHESIMERATEAALTMRMGGGIGYDFSTLRPKGALISTLQSRSSGPVSFMSIFDAVCKTIASSGHRRGAQMGVLRVDHPDIEEFIHVKQNQTALTAFNISVGVTDEFMRAVELDQDFPLRFNSVPYKTVRARALWEMIMRSTWDYAEPGVLFLDTINKTNNLWYCEDIVATNPCAEQPLPPNGACLLGSFNLTKYVNGALFEFQKLHADMAHVVRAMDNVVDRAIYPLEEQEREAKAKRRMGLGVTGVANAIEHMGYLNGVQTAPYGSDHFCAILGNILASIRNRAYTESVKLAMEKGPFPLFRPDPYLEGEFIETLPMAVRELICQHGIRNSHLTSIAPTGTISLCADNVSSGIEPVFAHEYDRTIQTFDGPKIEHVTDYALREWGLRCKPASDVTAEEHVKVLLTAQKYVDSAVSKTCNVSPDMPWDDFKDIYFKAWKGGAKGCTTFNTGGKRGGILNVATEAAACYIDEETGRRECE